MSSFKKSTVEPQYNNCLDISDEHGLTPLGLMTNQVWWDDPRRLVFSLARYKFVSKILSGRKKVLEAGCGDGFGARIVLQEVEQLDAIDFDPVFIEDINQRMTDRWAFSAHQHDLLSGPFDGHYDGIYSLDVMEHIQKKDENTYIRNLCDSLSEFGVVIIGMPSLESQSYASPPSKAGHVNCKSGSDLKKTLENYFNNVFLFSMNDEVVHTGFSPMAHYLFVVCTQKIIVE